MVFKGDDHFTRAVTDRVEGKLRSAPELIWTAPFEDGVDDDFDPVHRKKDKAFTIPAETSNGFRWPS